MKLIIKPDRGFGKIKVKLSDEIEAKILELSNKFGVPVERILEILILEDFKDPPAINIEDLEKEISELEKKVWELEMEFAPLKFKAYNLTQENKLLAIELSGLLAENVQLKRFLKKKIDRNIELRKLITYYMNLGG
nr:hypothetical protein [Pyrococcus abyssi]